jgi:hypothetical protein
MEDENDPTLRKVGEEYQLEKHGDSPHYDYIEAYRVLMSYGYESA